MTDIARTLTRLLLARYQRLLRAKGVGPAGPDGLPVATPSGSAAAGVQPGTLPSSNTLLWSKVPSSPVVAASRSGGPALAGSRTKSPVESGRGCIPLSQIPLRAVVATSRPVEYRGGRIPYKEKRSIPWLPDPVQTHCSSLFAGPRTKNTVKSRGNSIPRDLVSRSKTGPGECSDKFGTTVSRRTFGVFKADYGMSPVWHWR